MKDSDVSSDDRTDTCTFTEEERNTKKVRFKVVGEDSMDNMVVDTTSVKEISWKEMLLGRNGSESGVGDSDGDLIIEDDFGAKKSGVDNSGAEILGLKEIAFKQGNFSRKLKDNRPGGNYGHRAEGNKGKEIVDHNRFIGLKDKASGLVHLEVEQGKAGQGQTHRDLILENKTGSNPDGSQPISTGPMESKVILDFNVLDPKRHSTVIFKGNSDHKIVATELNIRPSDSSILSAPSKGHGLDNKK
ncbi:hypothetical protein PVK06_003096 [Gossypium arboreum]|uniref:Uncharacterized protein n=1 Tax=Gossypium arboreum TaxID=29729 RepID=A0ABR0R6G9_GOSAR|nr:hypothetical protein PVK06_003096 [Gossypium arboreum]